MSFPLLANTVARAFPQGLDDDELERQRRVKRAASAGVDDLVDRGDSQPRSEPPSGIIAPEARLYGAGPQRVTFRDAPVNPQPSIARAAPVVDVTAGNDGVFRRAGESPPPNTLSAPTGTAPMRATYEQPVTPPAPRPVDRQHVDFNQPNPMDALAVQRATQGNGNVSPDLYSTIAPGPEQRELERVQAAGPQPAHGWGRVGRGVLRLLSGDPVGAGAEWIAPGFTAKQRYQRHDLPLAQHNAEVEQEMQTRRVGDMGRIASETGRLPGGELTAPERARQTQQDINRTKQAELDADRDRRAAETERWHRETGGYRDRKQLTTEMNAYLRNVAPFGTLTETDREGFQRRYNVRLPDDFDPRKHDLIDTGEGWSSVVRNTGQGAVAVDETGKPLASPKGAAIDAANERAAAAQAGANQRAASAQAGADRRAAMRGAGGSRRTHAQAETEAAAALGADKDGMVDNPDWKKAHDDAYTLFDYEKDDAKREIKAARQADRVVKAGKRIPANKHPQFHLKVQGLMGGQASGQGAPRSLSQADIKAYADVNYGGDVTKARARIASEHPDWRLP